MYISKSTIEKLYEKSLETEEVTIKKGLKKEVRNEKTGKALQAEEELRKLANNDKAIVVIGQIEEPSVDTAILTTREKEKKQKEENEGRKRDKQNLKELGFKNVRVLTKKNQGNTDIRKQQYLQYMTIYDYINSKRKISQIKDSRIQLEELPQKTQKDLKDIRKQKEDERNIKTKIRRSNIILNPDEFYDVYELSKGESKQSLQDLGLTREYAEEILQSKKRIILETNKFVNNNYKQYNNGDSLDGKIVPQINMGILSKMRPADEQEILKGTYEYTFDTFYSDLRERLVNKELHPQMAEIKKPEINKEVGDYQYGVNPLETEIQNNQYSAGKGKFNEATRESEERYERKMQNETRSLADWIETKVESRSDEPSRKSSLRTFKEIIH